MAAKMDVLSSITAIFPSPLNSKLITKEQEPERYLQTAGERPLPYIIISGMSTPFIILAIAFANGWFKALFDDYIQ